ncbi:CDP-alcohol phosphatidyltransferase family protein, partial [Escherichia coli]|nr:CDP-alcohol phosphatidyltransferase family protein [Escherichia coli]
AILFIVAASTDKLDGYLARRYNQVTELGKLIDPIADKLLICGAFIVLSIQGEIWWWVTILFLVREIGITVMRFFVID